MLNKIGIEGIKLYAYHGCLEEEAKIGGNYIVDVYLEADFTKAMKSDDLNHTIDYCAVYEIVKEEMALRSKLIEQVAARIHASLTRSFRTVTLARVRVTKLSPPMNGNVEKVFVEVE